MLLYVNQKDIDTAREGCTECVVSRALTRRFPPPVGMHWSTAYRTNPDGTRYIGGMATLRRSSSAPVGTPYTKTRYRIGAAGFELMRAFDAREVVTPRHIRIYEEAL